MTCEAVTSSGAPCRAKPVRGMTFCVRHQPGATRGAVSMLELRGWLSRVAADAEILERRIRLAGDTADALTVRWLEQTAAALPRLIDAARERTTHRH